MANYEAYARTNYFRVTDVEKMKDFCKRNYLEFWQEDEESAPKDRYGFASCEPFDYDTLIPEIQEFLDENDICVIIEIGREKLRYLVGEATLITKSNVKYIILNDIVRGEVDKLDLSESVKDNFHIEY